MQDARQRARHGASRHAQPVSASVSVSVLVPVGEVSQQKAFCKTKLHSTPGSLSYTRGVISKVAQNLWATLSNGSLQTKPGQNRVQNSGDALHREQEN